MIPEDFHNLLKQRYKIYYFILLSSTLDVCLLSRVTSVYKKGTI